MNGWDMPDLYRAPRGPQESQHHSAMANSPMQEGEWYFEPHYHGSFDFLYHPRKLITLSRSLHAITLPEAFRNVCANVIQTNVKEDVWLQCVGFPMPDPANRDSFAVGVVDYQDFTKTYLQRRYILESGGLQELGIKLTPDNNYAFLVPRFRETIKLNLWFALQQVNHEKGRMVYDGIMAKRGDSKYESQLDDYKHANPYWHFHPFTQ